MPPYLISGQSLAVDTRRLPNVGSVDDLEGLTIGVQQGNTSGPIAEKLVADGRAAPGQGLRLRQHPRRARRPQHRRV